jgi:hypothetical protein
VDETSKGLMFAPQPLRRRSPRQFLGQTNWIACPEQPASILG